MRIAILGRPDSWHAQQLHSAGARLGYPTQIVPFERPIGLVDTGAQIRLGAVNLLDFDAILVRAIPPGSLEQVVFRMDALQRVADAGLLVVNPPKAIETCVDKFLTTARLQKSGILVPPTVVCEDLDDAMQAFEALGGDMIVKPIFGSEGRGMMRLDNESIAYRVLRTLVKVHSVLYLQKYIAGPGYDIRALVVGNRIVASMRRFATTDFRTNVSRGGRFEAFPLPPEWFELALRCADAVGAKIAGVDLLPDNSGQVWAIEVNSAPGFQALAQTTSVDIPAEMLQFLAATSA